MHKRWEYCVLTGGLGGINGFDTSYPKLTYFNLNGIARVDDLGNRDSQNRPKEFRDVDEADYTAATIARLGEEGWEMTGVASLGRGDGTGSHNIYFRRELRD